ncbi:glycosyltransferase family 2 protein [Rhizobium sp. TRM95796]|uniref:glycosyltransferase family 2 protein n=1 Tax=Rhizobium sp. TRM95796 TaxID=2979862 RepID=UPI0021E80712|nr:glycosyltransferase [Rhizobium sp. TRM95796]MCV3766460.1 glycosyltransferase [Rhizobium sp. TRM95796]
MTTPYLSICVPSRNRQRYFKELILSLLASPRADVQFVLADNSDDAEDMAAFVTARPDPRVTFLPSADRVLSMQENWERAVDAAVGDWVSVIGDDDQIDPDLVEALKLAEALKPGLDAFAWTNLHYGWRTLETPRHTVRLPVKATFHDMPAWFVRRRAFGWADASATIVSGFSIYHAALSRRLLNRIRKRFGDVWFGHPIVDYDAALKTAAEGEAFVYCTRPFSTFGACPEANSAALYDLRKLREAHDRFDRETGRETDRDPWLSDFPFPTTLGLPAAVGQVQMWLAHAHGVAMEPGWEVNFARACAAYCRGFADKNDFEIISAALRTAFARWRGGAFAAAFQPEFQSRPSGDVFTGLSGDALHVADDICGAATPTAFYAVVNGLLERPSEIKPELRSAGREFALLNSL